MDSNRYEVVVPVTITCSDEDSLADAKKYLRSFFFNLQSSANIAGLQWTLEVQEPKLRRKSDE